MVSCQRIRDCDWLDSFSGDIRKHPGHISPGLSGFRFGLENVLLHPRSGNHPSVYRRIQGRQGST